MRFLRSAQNDGIPVHNANIQISHQSNNDRLVTGWIYLVSGKMRITNGCEFSNKMNFDLTQLIEQVHKRIMDNV